MILLFVVLTDVPTDDTPQSLLNDAQRSIEILRAMEMHPVPKTCVALTEGLLDTAKRKVSDRSSQALGSTESQVTHEKPKEALGIQTAFLPGQVHFAAHGRSDDEIPRMLAPTRPNATQQTLTPSYQLPPIQAPPAGILHDDVPTPSSAPAAADPEYFWEGLLNMNLPSNIDTFLHEDALSPRGQAYSGAFPFTYLDQHGEFLRLP
jgi:hypothetical protein